MQQHDYDPTQDTFHNFVQWIERRCEPFDNREPRNGKEGPMDKPIPKKKQASKRKHDGNNTPGNGESAANKGRKYCIHHKWCDHTTDKCKVIKAMYQEHAPPKKYVQQKKANDLHMIQQASKGITKDFLDSEECFAILKKHITKISNPLFKAMKNEMREEFFMINENETGLALNRDTSDNEMDEADNDNDY